jgi:probable DNA metabolism protein
MRHQIFPASFDEWRNAARTLLVEGVPPNDVIWTPGWQGALFEYASEETSSAELKVPAGFIGLAQAVACHSDDEKWHLLYSLLYRLVNENRSLLEIESDPNVRQARLMEKAVGRDVHKFHAFVRFRKIECAGEEVYAAWHEPHHFTVERASPFFARRFGSMKFSILTPKGCAHWDHHELTFSEPAERAAAPTADDMEEYWLLYYRSIFNPFRLKVNTMKRELPPRHWNTLPEAALIPELIRQGRSNNA